jgi:hypothetical protein
VNNPRSVTPAEPRNSFFAAWTAFWFTPADPVALSVLRVLGGLVFLYWLLPFASDPQAFFGLGGWFDARAYTGASHLTELPPYLFSWSATYWCGNNPTLLLALYWLSIAAVALFTLGVATRLTGVLTWLSVVSFTANPAVASDADPLLQMLAFYLMLGYLFLGVLAPGQSPLARALRPTRETWLLGALWPRRRAALRPSVAANLALRLLQVHFAIAMVATGLHKLQVGAWWAGLAPWFYLHPPFHSTLAEIQTYAPPNAETYMNVFSLVAYAVLAWQIGFPVFAWRLRWRPLLLGGAAFGWLLTALALQIPVVGPVVFVICLAYVTPAEWRWVESPLARFRGTSSLSAQEPTTPTAAPAARGLKGGTRRGAITVGSRTP